MILQQGYQWVSIGTIGTTVVTAYPANIIGVFVPGTYVGTVILYDAAAAGVTTSPVGTLGIPNTSVAGFIEIPARCRNGIVAAATGTPTMTLFWDGL